MDMITNYYRPKRWVALLLTMLTVCLSASAADLTINAKAWEIGGQVGSTYDVTISNRTYAAGQWDMICLPFDASTSVLDAAFGAGNYTIQEFDALDGTKFKFKLMETPSLTAGYAYFIKVSSEVVNPVFPGVTLAMNSETTIHQGSDDIYFSGTFFPKAGWELINNYHAYKWYNGGLLKMAYMGDGTPDQADVVGCNGFFATDGSTAITVSLESTSSGSGEGGEGGEGTGGTLAEKISNRQQLSNVPTIYIDIPEVTDLDSQLYKDRNTGSATYGYAPYYHATIKVIATDDTSSPHYCESFEELNLQDLEIKARGNSTADPSKRAYRLKFAKKSGSSDGKAHKHDLLGRGYAKRNWILMANAFDNSLIRNALTSELSQMVGMPFVPGYKFVDLVINGEYRGTYQVTDHCEADADRINVNEDTGWYIEFQGRGDMLDRPVCFEQPFPVNVKNPEPEDETDTEALAAFLQPFKDWLQNTWAASFDKSGYTDPVSGWRSTNDEDVWLKYLLVTEITADYDGLMSVKACREADGKLMPACVWDKDLAYGNITCSQDGILSIDVPNGTVPRVYVAKMYNDPAFIKRMKETFDQMVADGLYQTLCDKIDMLAGLVTETRQLNYDRWGVTPPTGSMEVFYAWQEYEPYVQQLKDWLQTRIATVQQLLTEKCEEVCVVTDYTYDVTSGEMGQKDQLMNVTMINRSFTANAWNAITLPFYVDENRLKAVFGDQVDLREFTDVSTDGNTMLFLAPEEKAIKAGYPYLIKPSKTVDASPLFEEVIISATTGWMNNSFVNGVSVTHGNYTFTAHLLKSNIAINGANFLIGTDGTTLTEPQKQNTWDTSASVNGSIAYITVASGAGKPAISFTEEQAEPRIQLTDVPTIYIDTQDGAEIQPSSGDYVKAAIQVVDANGRLAEFTDLNDLEIRGKGSWDKDKKSYRLKFAKKKKSSDGLEHKYDLTGAGYVKRNWVLLGNAGDESLLRNALTKALGDGLDMPFTPTYCFVDVVLNGEYIGAYMATDFIEADAARVFAADEKTDWLLQMTDADDVDPADLYVEGSDTKPYITIKNPDSDDYTDEQKAALQSTVQTYFDQLWADNSGQYYDQTSLVNWYIAAEILGGYKPISDFYAYKADAAATLSFGPLWDNESSYDNTASIDMMALMADKDTEGSYNGMAYQITDGAWADKLAELWQQEWFKSAVLARWNEVKGTLESALTAKVAALKDEAAQTFTLNYDTFVASDGAAKAAATLDEAATQISNYLEARFGYLDVKFAELAASAALKGDVNNDGLIDINDVMALVSYICGETPEVFNIDAAYVNSDEEIDINDVMMLVDTVVNANAQ